MHYTNYLLEFPSLSASSERTFLRSWRQGVPLPKPEVAHAIGSILSKSVREQTIAVYQSLKKFLRDFAEIELPEVPDFIKPKTRRELPKPVSEEVFWKMIKIAEERAKEGFPWKLAAIILMGLAG
jgi:hypothetical protein